MDLANFLKSLVHSNAPQQGEEILCRDCGFFCYGADDFRNHMNKFHPSLMSSVDEQRPAIIRPIAKRPSPKLTVISPFQRPSKAPCDDDDGYIKNNNSNSESLSSVAHLIKTTVTSMGQSVNGGLLAPEMQNLAKLYFTREMTSSPESEIIMSTSSDYNFSRDSHHSRSSAVLSMERREEIIEQLLGYPGPTSSPANSSSVSSSSLPPSAKIATLPQALNLTLQKLLHVDAADHVIAPDVNTTHNKLVQCDCCWRQFDNENELLQHRQSHDDEAQPYRCRICKAAFKRSRHRNAHTRRHPEVYQPYACDFCGKRYSRKFSLGIHKEACQRHLNKMEAVRKNVLEPPGERHQVGVIKCNKIISKTQLALADEIK